MNQQTSGPCSVKGCPEDGVCLDTKNYTQSRSDLLPDDLFKDSIDQDVEQENQRKVFFCVPHAVKYLFPLIDSAFGNTTGKILEDFRADEMM